MKKRILVVYTGGTIGMVVTDAGYAPDSGFERKMRDAQNDWPEVGAALDWSWLAIEPPIDSADMTQRHWLEMRDRIVAALAQEAHDGVVVLHGTDTLAYTASALAFLLRGLPAPVVLTGAMRPAGQPDTDAWGNLFGSMLAHREALSPGVHVYFHGRLLPGARVTKLHSDLDDAFHVLRPESLPLQPLRQQIPFDYRTRVQEVKLAVAPLYPGLRAEVLRALLSGGVQGAVLECYGTGTGPAGDAALMDVLRQAAAHGVVIVGISQCPAGRMAPGQYAAGSLLRRAGVLPSGGMTREAALGKLFCLLGAGVSAADMAFWWECNLCGEHGQ